MNYKFNIASAERFGRQANAQQPQLSGNPSSEKMKTLSKWPLMPLMLLLALCMTTYSQAQTSNYIGLTSGTANVYDHNTPVNITTGANGNAFFGNNCGTLISTGASNCLFGSGCGATLASGTGNTFMGAASGGGSTGSNNTYIGISTGVSDVSGSHNTALGYGAGMSAPALTDATAIGSNATVSNSDAMVFGDGSVTTWGFGGDVTTAGAIMQVNNGGSTYAYLDALGWHVISDRRLKENFQEVDENIILQKVMNLSITKWNYIADPNHLQHIGPMAQDFYAAFHLDNDSTHVSEIEPGNIALVAIKALGKQNVGLTNQVQGLTSQNQALQAQNVQLQNSMNDLQDKFNTVLAEIVNLKAIQAQCCGSVGNTQTGSDNSGNGQASLAQNAPNPFSQNTVISYYLPANMPNAVITVRTLTGVLLKSFNITSPGAGQVTVNAGALAPGTYEYDMISNNQVIDSKKMVIVGE